MTSSNSQQREILTLFERVSKPVSQASLSRRGAAGASLVPPDDELVRLRDSLNLRSRGIGFYPRGVPCSLFDWNSMNEATKLAALLVAQPSYDAFYRVSMAVRGVVNEEIYVFSNMSALLQRQDTRGVRLPPIEEVLPYWYFPSTVISRAERLVKESEDETERLVVDYEFAHNQRDHEFRVAYFREDVAVNSHHWHWHVAYPFTWEPSQGGTKDRKGELFYYMHQQVLARFDVERLCNNLPRVRPLSDLRHPLEEGYFPNLVSTISGNHYEPRPANMPIKDVGGNMTHEMMFQWKSRILEAIHKRHAIKPDGGTVPLVEPRGIDVLGDIIEPTAISPNRLYYGEYHNFGHRLISRVHDPEEKFTVNRGVMASTATAMRDPIFYRWHKEIDNVFNEYKEGVEPYAVEEITWDDVLVSSVSITGDVTKTTNAVQTYWQEREVLLSSGVDFGRNNPVYVKLRHLQHEEFQYDIEVDNRSGGELSATIRIFLAPIINEFGEEFQFSEQRRLFCELDKFQTKLKSGKQVVARRFEESNVTLPTAQGFNVLASSTLPEQTNGGFCGCGWPGHLLLPKGLPQGMRFVLFVMLTNWDTDKVENLPDKACGDAASYCGIRDQKYPDKRAMGFPFDRRFLPGTRFIDFMTPNMGSKEINIRHSGTIVGVNGQP